MMILQEYIQSETMELLMQQTVSRVLVNTREACSIFGPNQLTHQNMRNCRVMTFVIEDWGTAQTNVSVRQFLIQSD